MLEQVRGMLRRYDMLQPGDTLTCAVSGGADSMALLWCMYLMKDKLQLNLQVAHFNHGLRGAESDRDEAFVRQFCDRFDIPLLVGRGSVEAGKKGLEAAARDARYGFLETIPGKLATAHTADDNAETVLMHMVRGTGLKGLGGITPVRGRLIRPMLTVTRQQVLELLEEYHIPYVTDSSNETDAFLRNRLRHHVMPLLQQENPRLAENLSAMAMRLREDEAALTPGSDSRQLLIEPLLQLPEALQNRRIAEFLRLWGVKEPDSDHIALVRALALSQKPSARASLPGAVTVCRRYDRLMVLTDSPLPGEKELTCPGITEFAGVRIQCLPAATGEPEAVYPVGKLQVRSRQSGDAICLPGGTRSLKKLFIDRKIPADRRPFVPVVVDDRGILAVGGIGIDRSRAAHEGTAVKITFLYTEKMEEFTDAE